MIPGSPAVIDLRTILAHNVLDVHFHPIVSVRQRCVVGVEALSRGRDSVGNLVPPAQLFRLAADQGLTLNLDRACRRAAVEQFVPLQRANNKLVLFLNTHASTLVEDVRHPNALRHLVHQYGIDPRNVAIEILEADAIDTAQLRAATDLYNSQGFLVVLDDVGAGYSNLDRIMVVRPDMLKADRALVHDLHRDMYKQGVFKALVILAERIGGWLVTEGVETREDALVALDLGADMLQGFFFGRPQPLHSLADLDGMMDRVAETADHFRRYTLDHFIMLREQEQHRRTVVQQLAAHLAYTEPHQLDRKLANAIDAYPGIASACVVDAAGRQITATVQPSQPFDAQKTIIFEPPTKGSDHSLKEYFYVLAETDIDIFETQPYVPLPSQRLCITVSTTFPDRQEQRCVLCVHMDAPEGERL